MKIKALLLFLFLSGMLHAQSFDWSLGMVDLRKGLSLGFSRPLRLERGDTVGVFLQSNADCWVYIVAQDSNRDVAVIHNGLVKEKEAFRTSPIQIMPPSGQDTIYIIVSRKQEKTIEDRIAIFEKEQDFRTGRNVINAVMELRREILNLNEAPERPLQLGGAFRGSENLEGINYSGAEKYFKTIIINH